MPPELPLVGIHWTNPATAPLKQVATVPDNSDRAPSTANSARRSGSIAAMPPTRIPKLPKLAKPHRANVMINRLCGDSAPSGSAAIPR